MLVTEIHYVNNPIQLMHSPGTEFSIQCMQVGCVGGQNVWWGAMAMSLCSTLRDGACTFPTAIALVFSVLIRSPAYAHYTVTQSSCYIRLPVSH